jgi:hypothetical protein
VLSQDLQGSLPACPDVNSDAYCVAKPGTYTYLVRAFDGNGAEVARQTATLTITP